jgi:hypothetical protein
LITVSRERGFVKRRRALFRYATTLLVCGLLAGCSAVKGNDTGGIIPYAAVEPAAASDLAAEHCARYAKVPRATGVDPQYGGYYSFACTWNPRAPH